MVHGALVEGSGQTRKPAVRAVFIKIWGRSVDNKKKLYKDFEDGLTLNRLEKSFGVPYLIRVFLKLLDVLEGNIWRISAF